MANRLMQIQNKEKRHPWIYRHTKLITALGLEMSIITPAKVFGKKNKIKNEVFLKDIVKYGNL